MFKLRGNPTYYPVESFPYKDGFPPAHDSMHIVLDREHFEPGFRTVGAFQQESGSALANVVVVTLAAEAVTALLRNRGTHARKLFCGDNPRAQVMLTYVTREIFANPQNRALLPTSELFASDNIVAMVFSIMLFDQDITLSDGFGDILTINQRGAPWNKPPQQHQKPPGMPARRRQNAPLAEDEEGDANILPLLGALGLVPPPPGPEGDAAVAGANRPDIPGQSLACMGSRYHYPEVNTEHQKLLRRTGDQYQYLRINSISTYIGVLQLATNNIAFSTKGESDLHLTELGPDFPYQPAAYFSFDAALDRLRQLGAASMFLDRDAWFSRQRPGFAPGTEVFGPPCWADSTELVFEDKPPFMARLPRFRANIAPVSALVPLKYFTAAQLIQGCLPHCRITDQTLLRPQKARGTFVPYTTQRDQVLARRRLTLEREYIAGNQPALGDDEQANQDARRRIAELASAYAEQQIAREKAEAEELNPGSHQPVTVCREDLLASMGLETAAMRHIRTQNQLLNRDLLNAYYDQFAPYAAQLRNLIGSLKEPSHQYIEQLAQLRQQGYDFFYSNNSVTNPDLPRGYKALIYACWERRSWRPLYVGLWQRGDVAMTAFAQIKVAQLLTLESIIKCADTTLFLMPVLHRAAMTTYLPTVGSFPNKEHVQVVCGPGTSKSDTMNRLTSEMLIPDTWDPQGGASNHGMMGDPTSERVIEIYHELPHWYAPSEDPKSEESMKTHKMLLGALSETKKIYTTTEKPINEQGYEEARRIVKRNSEYTNTILGMRNYVQFTGKPGGSGEAMTDRFTIKAILPVISDKRVSLAVQVLQSGPAIRSEANILSREQYGLWQRGIMEVGALISYYAVPEPDLSLLSDLGPLAVSYLAVQNPSLFFKLRNIASLKTRALAEIIADASYKVLFTVLNPTAHETVGPDGTVHVEFEEYDTRRFADEVAHYLYTTMEHVVYVLTEKMVELTGSNNPMLLCNWAGRRAVYYPLGFGAAECSKGYIAQHWLPEAGYDSSVPYVYRRINELLEQPGTVGHFVKHFIDNADAVYYLGVPISERDKRNINMTHNLKPRPATGGGGGGEHAAAAGAGAAGPAGTPKAPPPPPVTPAHIQNSFELIREEVPEEYIEIFELNAMQNSQPVKLQRTEIPQYKPEWDEKTGEKSLNPNYVKFGSTIYSFARSISGRTGNYNISESTIVEMLFDLAHQQTMITPYLPLITRPMARSLEYYNSVQSLRYIPGVMSRLPKYRVPVVINDPDQHAFYVLISYLETNPFKVAEGMIEHISYQRTRPRRTIMGVPSTCGNLIYQPIDIRAVPGKKLIIPGKNNIRSSTRDILASYFSDSNTSSGQRLADDTILQSDGKCFTDVDIEHEYALNFLYKNFPTEDRRRLEERYTPLGIHKRLYGPNGFYTRHQKGLLTRTYPHVLLEVKPNPPAAATTTAATTNASSAAIRLPSDIDEMYGVDSNPASSSSSQPSLRKSKLARALSDNSNSSSGSENPFEEPKSHDNGQFIANSNSGFASSANSRLFEQPTSTRAESSADSSRTPLLSAQQQHHQPLPEPRRFQHISAPAPPAEKRTFLSW